MTSRRDRLSNAAAGLGVTRVLEALTYRPSLIVVNYHRIADAEACEYDRGVIDASPEQFDQQIAFLKSTYDVVDLDTARRFADRRTRPRRPHVLVTFDDGYRDAYDTALPILQNHGVPAVFFLATGFVGTNRVPWWDQIAYVVRRTRNRVLALSYPASTRLDCGSLGPEMTIRSLLRMYKQPQVTDTTRFLRSVEEACDIPLPETAGERLFLSWTEAAALATAGMSIGSHTHRHELLSKLSEAEQREECAASRRILFEKLGVAVSTLSYPVGSRESFTAATKKCLSETGYEVAFSYYGGVNMGHMDPFNLLRIAVDPMALPQYRFRMAVAATLGRQLW